MPGISNEDRELADAARKKAGSVTALAAIFGVTIQTASGWGRRYGIPRHARSKLRAFVEGIPETAPPLPAPQARPTDPLTALAEQIAALREEVAGLATALAQDRAAALVAATKRMREGRGRRQGKTA